MLSKVGSRGLSKRTRGLSLRDKSDRSRWVVCVVENVKIDEALDDSFRGCPFSLVLTRPARTVLLLSTPMSGSVADQTTMLWVRVWYRDTRDGSGNQVAKVVQFTAGLAQVSGRPQWCLESALSRSPLVHHVHLRTW